MSISSVASAGGSYGISMHGPNCQCPACQQLRAQAASIPTTSSGGNDSSGSQAVAGGSASGKSGNDAGSGSSGGNGAQNSNPATPKTPDGKPLNADQQKQVAELKARDTDVRRHEAAHQAAGGALAGAASFTYEQGPDGKQYAIGGEVSIRVSQGNTPQETIQNAQTVRTAALAPVDPSGQDRAVAAEASQMEQQARMQLLQQQSGNPNLSPLQKAQQASSPSDSQTKPGQNVDTYA
ncbi:hypothetical protein BI347_11720 [Chromobacterium sphagni]|uniref:Catalase n=1 Tax=Chromobacterium sphagni TaxID=1903179 RepID=A0A1S1X3U8_9NEIS|nr:putative metalloprotease CJM1_0395 family protein [Chromobacterium sphagni]OHX14100.1 hypothetical protein BI347_11720 [Chromobacterium sphagni]